MDEQTFLTECCRSFILIPYPSVKTILYTIYNADSVTYVPSSY